VAEDILERIVADRRRDLARSGPAYGCVLPAARRRPVRPFLAEPGAILEIKRASPSRGDIAPELDPGELAIAYAAAGARAVSVLTERNYFKGSLDDLMAAAAAAPEMAFLRKDFLLSEDEIEASYRAGADAVLLIARLLDGETLRRMAAAARAYGMTPFIEIRDGADAAKLRTAAADGRTLSGVNARDLATFKLDPLVPAAWLSSLPGPAVYESGIDSPQAAAYARRLGFSGILVGEAAAKAPEKAAAVVAAFVGAKPDAVGEFWRRIAERRERRRAGGGPKRPLVKICGLTRADETVLAAELGADLIGCVFADSPRRADAEAVRAIAAALAARGDDRPILVGVVSELESPTARAALGLARAGVLEAIQYHLPAGTDPAAALARLDELEAALTVDGRLCAGRFLALPVGTAEDAAAVAGLGRFGEARVLADARTEGRLGGTGARIPREAVAALAGFGPFWLAGGLGPETIGAALDDFGPELVDASSRLEASPGRKDREKLERFFKEIDAHVR
jgi:indole-3-glycerol phosphate synthase/phosphoribosylanthranilate isomerase